MGKWSWEGFNKNGKRGRGQIEASNERDARKFLRAQGIRPTRITPPSILEFDFNEWMVQKGFTAPFGAKELAMFTRQLAIMINSGVPIMQALEILHKSIKHPTMRKTVKQVASDVSEGMTISEALEKHNGFGRLYCNMVKAGEAGGILDSILNKLNEHIEKQQKLKAQIKGALMYPTIVSVVGIGVVWGMLVFVVPQFMEMLKGNNQEIPAITQAVVDISEWLQEYIVVCVGGAVGLWLFILSYIKTPQGKELFDLITMKLPLFGGIIVKGNLSSFSRTMSTLLSSGVPLIDALEICIETLDNHVIANDLKKVRKLVMTGKTMAEPLAKISYMPDMIGQMLRVGEQTGAMDNMLLKVADVLEEEVSNLVGNMTKLIEPFIMVGLGGIVAFIMLAMYMPIFKAAG